MQSSAERILTTHAGSLPRPAELLSEMLARERGQPVDAGKLTADVRAGVAENVRRQLDAGVDVVNDGEASKPSFATYVKDRLTGLGGEPSMEGLARVAADLDDFPDFAERMAANMAPALEITFTTCDGPVSFTGRDAVQADIANLKAATDATDGAASPGVFLSAAPEAVAQCLIRYAGVVGRENVMAGTDCGFGTIAGYQAVVPSLVWAKLRSMAEGARLATERLWGRR